MSKYTNPNKLTEAAIITSVCPCTNMLPTRISVQASGNKKKFFSFDECQDLAIQNARKNKTEYENIGQEHVHFEAVKKYIQKIGYRIPKTMTYGGTEKGFVFLFDGAPVFKFGDKNESKIKSRTN